MNFDSNGVNQWHYRHDALEAFNSFAAVRNLLFWLTVICVFIVQGVFFAVDRGAIDPALDLPEYPSSLLYEIQPNEQDKQEIQPEINSESQILKGSSNIESFVFCSFSENDLRKNTVAENSPPILSQKQISEDDNYSPEKASSRATAEIITTTLKNLISASNIVVIFSLLMYCICLFFLIQLSLTGSLGGLANSTWAFFTALLTALLVIPWYKAISQGIPTLIFSFDEILKVYSAKKIVSEHSSYDYIMYYGRFSGLWILILALLISSQWRSSKAVKEIISRAQQWKNTLPTEPQTIAREPMVNNQANHQTNCPLINSDCSDTNTGPIPLE